MKSTKSDKKIPRSALTTLRKVERFIDEHSMLSPGDRVLVALSGGADSTTLLHILYALRKKLNIELHVAHLNHNLRGDESAGDARFAGELAKQLDLPVTVHTLAEGELKKRGRAKQDMAREVRYDFLRRVAKKAGCSKIATGHTADDVAENVLMALIRGGGTKSLGGVPPVRENIIRPLLGLERREIMKFLEATDTPFREDSSNLKADYLRNQVRLELLPFLKERFNPAITETIARTAEVVRDDAALLEEEVENRLDSVIEEDDSETALPLDAIEPLHQAARRRLVRLAWQRVMAGADEYSLLSSGHVTAILTLCNDGQSGDSLCMPGGVTVEKGYRALHFRQKVKAYQPPSDIGPWFPEEGVMAIPALDIQVHIGATDQKDASNNALSVWTAAFDSGKISDRICIRTRRPGDTFYPVGMGGSRKKLQDFMVDEKIPRAMRDRVPLVCCGPDIMWVVGYRRDERFVPSSDTSSFVTVTIASERSRENAVW
ncbi:MAG: tRNA lysidine(34) synthetase TilS [Nitrospirota bacterium]|nr:tRNA lysidine(34) synthetase TilS [Nitrospirota bacterium]